MHHTMDFVNFEGEDFHDASIPFSWILRAFIGHCCKDVQIPRSLSYQELFLRPHLHDSKYAAYQNLSR